jgi:hypothetical protein
MHRNQRNECFLGDPVDRDARAVPADIVHDGQRMHDVAKRRWADDQGTTHPLRLMRIAARDATATLMVSVCG